MRNKVRGGTPAFDGPSLCRSCRHATVVEGTRLDDEIIQCGELSYRNDRITFKVTDCSSYLNKALPTLQAMRDIAWELRTDKAGRRIGFTSPIEAKRRNEELVDLPYLSDPKEDY
jgi:hypothetical protein